MILEIITFAIQLALFLFYMNTERVHKYTKVINWISVAFFIIMILASVIYTTNYFLWAALAGILLILSGILSLLITGKHKSFILKPNYSYVASATLAWYVVSQHLAGSMDDANTLSEILFIGLLMNAAIVYYSFM